MHRPQPFRTEREFTEWEDELAEREKEALRAFLEREHKTLNTAMRINGLVAGFAALAVLGAVAWTVHIIWNWLEQALLHWK